MDKIKIRIAGHECRGVVKERSQATRQEECGAGHAQVNIVFIDLDVKCVLSDFESLPLAEIEVAEGWRDAVIDRIPTAPDYKRIVLSFQR